MSLIYLSCAWVAGILLGSVFNLPLPLLLIGLIPLLLPFLLRHHRKASVLIGLCSIILCGGILRFQSDLPECDSNCLEFYNDQGVVELKGMVDSDPDAGDTTKLRFSAREIKTGDEWQTVTGTALLFVPPYPTYNYGDILHITGELTTPSQFEDFDYADYLARQGIHSTMLYPGIEVLDTGQGFPPLAWVYSLRNRLSRTIVEILPEPQASLTQGMVLGIRGNIPSSLKDDFAQSGTTHLLAISGLHLSIFTGLLLGIGRRLFGKKHYTYIWLTLGAVWLYAMITGMHPPVIRAAIMASLFLIAERLGRQRSAVTALTFTAAIMVGINPQVLWDASFQLSFVAMGGLMLISPWLQELGRRAINAVLGEGRLISIALSYVTDTFGMVLGILIAVWPLIAYHFGIISLVAPLATLSILAALPGIIISGLLAAFIGIIIMPVAQVIGWITWLFTSYMSAVVSGMAAFPASSIEVTSAGARLIWIYYLLLAAAFWLYHRRPSLPSIIPRSASLIARLPKKWVMPPLLVSAILATIAAATVPDSNLHVSILDVGQGDAILIQTPTHRDILVDGGPSPQEVSLALSRKMPFWDRTIDLVVLTHPHADHITGLIEVLQRYRVKQVLYPAMDYQSPLFDEWLSLIEEKGIEYTLAQAGQIIDIGVESVSIELLNPQVPPLSGTDSDTDNNGVVLRISTGRVSFLLTADVGWPTEYELIRQRANLQSTVLKVGHHGSDTSTSEEFLAVINPSVAVISVGADNNFGHPSEEVLERLVDEIGEENIYRTDEHGTIEFITDGERLWVRTER